MVNKPRCIRIFIFLSSFGVFGVNLLWLGPKVITLTTSNNNQNNDNQHYSLQPPNTSHNQQPKNEALAIYLNQMTTNQIGAATKRKRRKKQKAPLYFLNPNTTIVSSSEDDDDDEDDENDEEKEEEKEDDVEIHLNKKAVVCSCAKCGSTAFYLTLYSIIFGQEWNYKGPPWVQQVQDRERWHGIGSRFVDQSSTDVEEYFFSSPNNNKAFSFALIRDPKDRLLSSWRNKVSCHDPSNVKDRAKFVPQLLKLAKKLLKHSSSLSSVLTIATHKKDCLSLEEFLQALLVIHEQGQEHKLNPHFLPQHLGCFADVLPEQWSLVTTIKTPGAACQLEHGLTNNMTTTTIAAKTTNWTGRPECDFRKEHGSRKFAFDISPEAAKILDLITTKEYQVIGKYL